MICISPVEVLHLHYIIATVIVKDPSPKRDGLAKKYRPGNGKRARATPRLAWPKSGFCGNGAE